VRASSLFAIAVLLFCPAVLGQNAPTDAATLHAILDEVHRLRQDLQATSATVQRAQILLYRLRIQMDVVAQASQRLDEAKMMVAQIKSSREHFANYKKLQEESLERTSDLQMRKQIEEELESLKNQIEQIDNREPEAQAKEAECANQLRLEQGHLDQLQEQLDRLDRKLEAAAQQPVLAVEVNAPR
jgi:chromosome segregation ATPase